MPHPDEHQSQPLHTAAADAGAVEDVSLPLRACGSLSETRTAIHGLQGIDWLVVALEIAGSPISKHGAGLWADYAAGVIRPRLLATRSSHQALQSVWRFLPELPARWRFPAGFATPVLHSLARRMGLDVVFTAAGGQVGLGIEDLDADYVLTPEDGCVQEATLLPLRPKAVVARLLPAYAVSAVSTADKLRVARVAMWLNPGGSETTLRLATALLGAGQPAEAYDLIQPLLGGSDSRAAATIRDRAEADLARWN